MEWIVNMMEKKSERKLERKKILISTTTSAAPSTDNNPKTKTLKILRTERLFQTAIILLLYIFIPNIWEKKE